MYCCIYCTCASCCVGSASAKAWSAKGFQDIPSWNCHQPVACFESSRLISKTQHRQVVVLWDSPWLRKTVRLVEDGGCPRTSGQAICKLTPSTMPRGTGPSSSRPRRLFVFVFAQRCTTLGVATGLKIGTDFDGGSISLTSRTASRAFFGSGAAAYPSRCLSTSQLCTRFVANSRVREDLPWPSAWQYQAGSLAEKQFPEDQLAKQQLVGRG
jgi:hypothetical protein